MTNFEIAPFNLADIGYNGYGAIRTKVRGYWSQDVITLYVEHQFGSKEWGIRLSHSSGGRETTVVECDMEAEINFAEAIKAVAEIGLDIKNNQIAVLKENYQKRVQDDKEKMAAEKAALDAAIAADKEIGIALARYKLDTLGDYDTLKVFVRGTDKVRQFSVSHRIKKTFSLQGMRISKQEAIEELAKCSARKVTI
jgi:hypothetical protein